MSLIFWWKDGWIISLVEKFPPCLRFSGNGLRSSLFSIVQRIAKNAESHFSIVYIVSSRLSLAAMNLTSSMTMMKQKLSFRLQRDFIHQF